MILSSKTKKEMRVFLIVLVVLMFAVVNIGCEQYAGIYVSVDTPGVWLELRSDGTCETLLGWTGRWEVTGNQLTIAHPFGYDTYIIENGKIMTQTGEVCFVKK